MDNIIYHDSDSRALPPPKNFRLMVAGQIVTVLGSSLLRFALSLYVLDLTGRADIFASLFAISSIPMLLSPIGGAISDRFNRQRLMVLYDAVCCAVAFIFLFVLSSGRASVFAVGAVMVLLGIVGAMETPNGTACVPLLVEEGKLESANGIVQAVQSLSGIIAPLLGGILYGALELTALVAISGAAFGLAAGMELFISIPFVKRPQTGSITATILGDLKDGFAYMWNETDIRKFAKLAALLNMVMTPCIIVVVPLILRTVMGATDAVYGVGMGLIQFSTILGALTVGSFSKRMRIDTLWRWLAVMALLFFPATLSVTPVVLGSGFWPAFILLMLCTVMMAAMATIVSIYVIVRVQAKTPAENLGKVMAILMAICQCAAPVGQFLYGIALEKYSGAEYLPLLAAAGVSLCVAFFAKVSLKNER